MFALIVLTPNAKATQTSITPIADSCVSSIDPNTNYGGESSLFAYNFQDQILGNQFYNTWLKFDLSQISSEATVTSIILRMRTFIVVATNKVGVFLSDNTSWKELEITWNNQPSLSSTQSLQTLDIASANRDYDFELTTALKGKSMVSLVLKTLQSTGLSQFAQFDSREGSHGPRLIVDYTMPSSPNPDDFLPPTIILAIIAVVAISAVLMLRRRKRVNKQTPTTP